MEVNDTCKSIVHSHNSLLMVLSLEFNQNAVMGNFLPVKNILVFNNWAKWVLIVFCFLRPAGGRGGVWREGCVLYKQLHGLQESVQME